MQARILHDRIGRLTLGNQAVKVLVVGALKTQVATANVVDGLVVDHEGAVGVLEGGVGGEDGVVWFNNRGGNLWRWVDTEFQLALLAIVDRQALHQKSSKTGTSSTTKGVEDEEALETVAVVCEAANLVHHGVNHLLSNGVVATGV